MCVCSRWWDGRFSEVMFGFKWNIFWSGGENTTDLCSRLQPEGWEIAFHLIYNWESFLVFLCEHTSECIDKSRNKLSLIGQVSHLYHIFLYWDLPGVPLAIADDTCAHSLGHRPVQDIQRGKIKLKTKGRNDQMYCRFWRTPGWRWMVWTSVWDCGTHLETTTRIEGDLRSTWPFSTQLGRLGLPTVAPMWSSCVLILDGHSLLKTAGGFGKHDFGEVSRFFFSSVSGQCGTSRSGSSVPRWNTKIYLLWVVMCH